MSAKESWIDRIYNMLTAPKTIKICGYSVLAIFFGCLGLAVIIAVALGGHNYNIIDHWISDLGNHNYTPAPFLLDIAVITAGILLVPFHLYMEKYLAPIPRTPEELPPPPRMSYRLMGLNFFFNCFGSVGLIGVGIFSEDRDIAGLHFIFSVLLFGSFAIGAIFLGLQITFIKQPIVPKPLNYIIGAYGIFVPFTIAGFATFDLSPLWEWILFFVLIGLIVPVFVCALRHAEHQLKTKS
ncbi:MAG: DUF998 domain-containing protein [Candidatus Helarchaeota archaeon]|nr:DUF998 domain-containing protein [Candidatus Helarchaeota archaeon]